MFSASRVGRRLTTSAITSTNGGTGNAATATLVINPIIDPEEAFQVAYAANLPIGDSVFNFTNTGTLPLPAGLTTTGNICVNVYTFDASEELISCCTCLATPNGLNSVSARADLISNTLTPGVPTSIVVKLVASRPLGLTPAGTGGTCNADPADRDPGHARLGHNAARSSDDAGHLRCDRNTIPACAFERS